VKQQTRQLDVSVAKTVDDPDGVVGQDRPSFGGGLASDEQERHAGTIGRVVHQLPRRGRIGVTLELDGDVSVVAGEPQDGVGPAVCPARLGDHGKARGCSTATSRSRVVK
jgi:hypothetical protein